MSRNAAIAIALLGFALDRATKYIVTHAPFALDGFFWIDGALGLRLHVNEFFAWSLPVPNAAVLWVMLTVVIALGWVLYTKRAQAEVAGPLALVLAGALSNAADRLAYGGVVDYIVVPWGGVFNLADALVVFGIVLLVL